MSLVVITVTAVAIACAALAFAWRLARAERERSDARVAALAAAIDDTSADAKASMFERAPRSGLQGRPLVKVGVGLAMAVGIIVLIAMNGDRHAAAANKSVTTAHAQSAQDLELVSMRHTRAGANLKVTGLVRNRGAAATAPISAVVFVFDRDGGFVASGRAPIEFTGIANGDESPFHVTIPDVKDVGRYRVSFRTEAGVVPHVDRRPALQVAK